MGTYYTFSIRGQAKAVKYLQHREGFRSKPYPDLAGVWTIGYGSANFTEFDEIDEFHAMIKLVCDLRDVAVGLSKELPATLKLTAGQEAALLSITYHEGLYSIKTSELLRKINAGLLDECPAQFRRWIYYTDPVSKKKYQAQGLINRREEEIVMWLEKA